MADKFDISYEAMRRKAKTGTQKSTAWYRQQKVADEVFKPKVSEPSYGPEETNRWGEARLALDALSSAWGPVRKCSFDNDA